MHTIAIKWLELKHPWNTVLIVTTPNLFDTLIKNKHFTVKKNPLFVKTIQTIAFTSVFMQIKKLNEVPFHGSVPLCHLSSVNWTSKPCNP